MSVTAIILAAGASRRMGADNKLLLPLASGETMIAHVTAQVIASTATEVIVVTGHDDQNIKAALAGFSARFVHAPDHATGMAASLRAGIAALDAGTKAALICLGDMPLLDTATLNRIIAAYIPGRSQIIIPTCNGQRGNPVLWDARFFAAFSTLQGDAGAKQLLHKFPDDIYEIDAGTDAVLRDFDTPEAYAALRDCFKSRSGESPGGDF